MYSRIKTSLPEENACAFLTGFGGEPAPAVIWCREHAGNTDPTAFSGLKGERIGRSAGWAPPVRGSCAIYERKGAFIIASCSLMGVSVMESIVNSALHHNDVHYSSTEAEMIENFLHAVSRAQMLPPVPPPTLTPKPPLRYRSFSSLCSALSMQPHVFASPRRRSMVPCSWGL